MSFILMLHLRKSLNVWNYSLLSKVACLSILHKCCFKFENIPNNINVNKVTLICVKFWNQSNLHLKQLLIKFIESLNKIKIALGGKSPFPHTDWRFNEFPNPAAHALHVTCIELMALPTSTTAVGNALLDIILRGRTVTAHSNIIAWMNAVGLVLTALPEAYWSVLNDRILEVMKSPLLANPCSDMDPFLMFDFAGSYNSMTELPCSYLVALTHSVWYHASIGQICTLTQLLKEKFKPAVKTEEQFLFVCHLVSPFLQRFHVERTRYAMDITVELYEMLEAVDKNCEQLRYIDSVCDLLYHIKYMFIGDSIKNDIERSIRNLRPAIQRKLRFITHLNIDEMSVN